MSSTGRSITENVVHAVATSTNTDPMELPPLYETIDPDALGVAVNTMDAGEINFQYKGQSVTVHADGTVNVTTSSMSQFAQQKPATDD